MRRVIRDSGVADKAKRNKRLCEHCRWRTPYGSELLHAHHVIPLSCGGPDTIDNLIILCPNCHAIAHFVAPRTNSTRQYSGPQTAAELRQWMSAARKPNELSKLRRVHMIGSVAPILAEMRA